MSEIKAKPLNELLSKSMVDIYVGLDNTHWILHEKLLCHHSAFFRKIFYDSSRSESSSKSFGLPDEEDASFRAFVGWLYSSSLPVPRQEADLGVLFDLYLMGEKWHIEELVREVLRVVREWYKYSDSYPGLRRVQYIYANTEEGSPMRGMLVHSVARLLVLKDGIPQHWDKALRKNGQLAVDIIKAIQDWRLEEENVPDAREEPSDEEKEHEKDEGYVSKEEPEIKEEKNEEEGAKFTNGLMKELPNGLSNGVNGVHH
ncbi:hypothetical protein AOQ84DRAFT_328568 [Glonium stellatum]|uniref:BTB domain-containing protein n=1 Tax=Glonium stellatum TaxID=574774 RepID=A0A8E2ENH5_9PEZI|nr:hypothetical protein AOQ84DRAFT_328568 [Glonium stellatum]